VVRAEGHTELVGDLILICTGGNPAQALTANFQLFLNTNITSRLIGGGLSEALLMIDEPGAARLDATGAAGTPTPFCVSPDSGSNSAPAVNGGTPVTSQVPGLIPGGLLGTGTAPGCNNVGAVAGQTYQQGTYTLFRGQAANAANGTANAAVVWPGVPIVPPGTAGARTIRITNIRANAAGVPASASLVPAQIFAFLSVSASQSLALSNPQQAVAFVLPGLQFDVRSCSGGGGSPFSFLQCNAQNGGNSGLASSASGTGSASFGVRFREGFQTAFKTRIEGDATGSTLQFMSIPGVVYNTESGFVRPELGALVGQATSATRVSARFTNIPEGVRLYVSTNSVTSSTNVEVGSTTANAMLVSVTDPNGSGSTGVSATATLTCTNLPNASAAEVPLTGTGNARSGIATWEVTSANSAVIDTLFFQVGIGFNFAAGNPAATPPVAAQPGLGTSSVTGSFAPFYAASSDAGTASSSLPIPRFIDNATPRNALVINPCVTNLLFPFVTNQAGFDTGIAISNTSRDPFSGNAGRLQSGTSTINYYGNSGGTNPAPPADTTTGPVNAGEQLLFVLSSGGGNGIDATPNFQGYIIAQCRFQYAHGFAFVTDGPVGQAQIAEGYLALVMDSGIGTRTGSASEVLNH